MSVVLLCVTSQLPSNTQTISGLDVTSGKAPADKAAGLLEQEWSSVAQQKLLRNPDSIITLDHLEQQNLLSLHATVAAGSQPGQTARVTRYFWEFPYLYRGWAFMESSPDGIDPYSGKSEVCISVERFDSLGITEAVIRGRQVWGKPGVLVSKMTSLPAALYSGCFFDDNTFAIVPKDKSDLAAVWAFVSSGEFAESCRRLNQKLNVTVATMGQVGFDLSRWRQVTRETLPLGVPRPNSANPTAWLFDGAIPGSTNPLQVAVARLLGFAWPRQRGTSFVDCPAIACDQLEGSADGDGIVCFGSVSGEMPAADRLREILATAYGHDWSASNLSYLLGGSHSLEEWLRDRFFEEHCEVFRNRPFIWHVWDGRKDGFHAFVNYHKMAAPNGEGRKILEKLIYTALGDWIARQKAEVASGSDGADSRLAAAQHLQLELQNILLGEPPYDLFTWWKPIHEQALGWEPDLNDGIRLNIRPWLAATLAQHTNPKRGACILRITPKIKYGKDRGKETARQKAEFPWFVGSTDRNNDIHLSLDEKRAARERRKK